MKNKSIKSIILAFTVAFSLGSYIYLNSQAVSSANSDSNQIEFPTAEATSLPDIQVTKKLGKLAKELLPVSH